MVYNIIVLNRLWFLWKIFYGNVHQKIIVKVFIIKFFVVVVVIINNYWSIVANQTIVNYTTQFLGVQYFVDLSIIQYVTNVNQNESSVSRFLWLSILNRKIIFRSTWIISVVLQFIWISFILVLVSLFLYFLHLFILLHSY